MLCLEERSESGHIFVLQTRSPTLILGLPPQQDQQQQSRSGGISGSSGSSGALSINNFVCSVCSKSFLSGWEMRRHLHAHIDARPFCCPYCSHRSNFKHNLKSHIRSIHPGKPFAFTLDTNRTSEGIQ